MLGAAAIACAALLMCAPSAHAAACDPIGAGQCLLPFPNDHFTERADTPTGRRLALPRAAMPANKDGVRIDPREWNRADGFSPGQQITVRVPGLDSRRAFERSGIAPITDIGQSLARRQPVVLIDARTGRRQPYWAELDSSAPSDAERALLIRPARNLKAGRRYVVALRRLRTAGGRRIAPKFAFRALRDRRMTRSRSIERRRPAMRRVFRALRRAGVARGNLVLAWDFTVASRRSTTGPMLHMRDAAFDALGDPNLRDLKPLGTSPLFTVTRNDPAPATDLEIARVVEGTVTAPCFLENAGCAVGKGFHRGADGLPEQKPGNTYAAFYRCVIPRDVPAGGGRALLYGHGLLGNPLDSRDSAQAQLKTLAHQQGFTVCGTYWSGLSAANAGEDTTQAAAAIQDLSKFGAITDRLQQGMLNALLLGRAMVAADGFRSHPAFAGAFDASQRLFYDGNSQGGIEGGALTAVAPDFDRAVLGVPGMNYSTLLQRSVDFDAVPLAARGRVPQAARPSGDLLAAVEPLGPRRVQRLRAVHDEPPAAGHACARGAAAGRARRPPGGAGDGRRDGADDRRARVEQARPGPLHRRAAVLRDPSAHALPVWRLGAGRVRLGPGHAREPAGHAAAADRQRASVGGRGPARVPAPHPGGADDEGPVPADRRPAADAAVRRRGVPLERVGRAVAAA